MWQSSIFKKIGEVKDPLPIAIGESILSTPVSIITDELTPGMAGHIRVWFSIITSDGNSTAMAVSVNNNFTTGHFFVNADMNFEIKSGGLYWFDVPNRDVIWSKNMVKKIGQSEFDKLYDMKFTQK